jgi:hypothetical protein
MFETVILLMFAIGMFGINLTLLIINVSKGNVVLSLIDCVTMWLALNIIGKCISVKVE